MLRTSLCPSSGTAPSSTAITAAVRCRGDSLACVSLDTKCEIRALGSCVENNNLVNFN